ncbi:TIGR03084 family metal-binding protein [Nocardioides speluncae]|uniref:TIGR03084 family metal-binding protein n=1 Tax=Nocardioides speluncae TaxID=2670337 RepID=UPI000D6910FA|nr:TIGR03084 family metal-binding protein [Nocardioides speluncae]
MNDLLESVLADLAAESGALDEAVASLTDEQWRQPTPAEGWTIAHQVIHLAWTDEAAVKAAGPKADWDAFLTEMFELGVGDAVDRTAGEGATMTGSAILTRWRGSRADLAATLRGVPDGQKLPWFGPPMSPVSMATARFMETWAHGLDVYDGLGVTVEPTDRIRHVVHIGVRTRNFAFQNNGLEPPAEEFRVELTAPSGEVWTYGPEDAVQRVTGSAYDFCLRVTQRRHRDDLDLKATGPDADQWLDIAQAFAGPSGAGREATRA